MHLLQLDGSNSPTHKTSPSLACNWNEIEPASLLRYRNVRSPASSLEFHDGNTENLTSYHDCIGSKVNGNLAAEARFAILAPLTAAQHYHGRMNRQLSRLNWGVVKRAVSGWAEEAFFEVEARINRAFEDRDVCEMGHRVTDFMPTVSLPTTSQLSQKFDTLSDDIQALLERVAPETNLEDEVLQGMQWVFARKMGEKVRHSLVKQGICKEWQVMLSQETLQWQIQLNQAMVRYFEQPQLGAYTHADFEAQLFFGNREGFSFSRLMDLEPVWIADRAKKVWQLDFDTLVVDLEKRNGTVVDTSKHLPSGFGLPESASSVFIKDYYRKTRTVDEDWEMLE
jgi:hypothetical protein